MSTATIEHVGYRQFVKEHYGDDAYVRFQVDELLDALIDAGWDHVSLGRALKGKPVREVLELLQGISGRYHSLPNEARRAIFPIVFESPTDKEWLRVALPLASKDLTHRFVVRTARLAESFPREALDAIDIGFAVHCDVSIGRDNRWTLLDADRFATEPILNSRRALEKALRSAQREKHDLPLQADSLRKQVLDVVNRADRPDFHSQWRTLIRQSCTTKAFGLPEFRKEFFMALMVGALHDVGHKPQHHRDFSNLVLQKVPSRSSWFAQSTYRETLEELSYVIEALTASRKADHGSKDTFVDFVLGAVYRSLRPIRRTRLFLPKRFVEFEDRFDVLYRLCEVREGLSTRQCLRLFEKQTVRNLAEEGYVEVTSERVRSHLDVRAVDMLRRKVDASLSSQGGEGGEQLIQ